MTGEERDDAVSDDTVRVSRDATVPDDQTVRVARTASVPPTAAGGQPGEPGAADQPSEPDDANEPDDATVLSRGRVGADTQPSGDPDTTDAAPGPRRNAGAPDADEPDDGSTMVAHRESRRRAAREDSPVAGAPVAERSAADLPAPSGRIAHAPGAIAPIYKPRAPEPVIVERTAPPPRPPQIPPHIRAEMLFRRRRARQLALVGVMAGCFVVTVLLAALVAFTTVGW